jgi:2,4-dienoyl-CoA reductase (NADPH2)
MTGETRFEKLLEPYHIGKVQTRNRMVKTAAGMFYQKDEYVSDMQKGFFEALAKGGVGLLFVDSPTIDYPQSLMFPIQFRIDDDKYIKGFSELTGVIHKHGCPAFLQLYHCGAWMKKETYGLSPVSASNISISSDVYGPTSEHASKDVPRPLTIAEIEDLVDKFASATVRAQKAGFDGVEINAGSNHLLASFLSPLWNKRQDAYGGSLENRARFLLAIIREIRKRMGRDFPICALINGVEVGGGNRGMSLAEGQELARMLEAAGVDAIHIRFYWYGYDISVLTPEMLFYPEPHIPLKDFPKEPDWSHKGAGANMSVAAEIRKAVSIPVIAGGRMDPELGEEALRQGKVDFVGFCRRLMADPELPNKVISGRMDDIVPCLGCLQCMSGVFTPVRCRVNAAMGREYEYTFKEAATKKKVLVAGGGPAGIEAARVAALRGHEVSLYDKEPELGGLMNTVGQLRGVEFEDQPTLIDYYKRQITKLGVKVNLGKEVTPSLVAEVRPDVVILATGGVPALPDIPGIRGSNVVAGPGRHYVLEDYIKLLGERVVIIGGAIQGCELAEVLVRQGKQVTIVDTAAEMGAGMAREIRARLLWWLTQKGVTMMPGIRYEAITDKGLTVTTGEGKRQTIEADTVVIALPLAASDDLLAKLEGKVPEVYAIGDSAEPGLMMDAINDGARIAHVI